MLTAVGRWARPWAWRTEPWTNVYGLSRTLLAGGTLLTLLCNDTATLFRPASGALDVPQCGGLHRLGAFCWVGGQLEWARWAMALILLVVASGWRPRLTGALHWWICFSLNANAMIVDGGDQVAAVLTFLLLPVTLTDPRKWHWQAGAQTTDTGDAGRIFARVGLAAIRVQVSAIYFHAAVAKLAVAEWANGTAVYYWLSDPLFGAAEWLRPMVSMVISSPAVVLVTWGVLALELLLCAALLLDPRHWRALLISGLLLHAGIALLHGLVSFGFSMAAALVLYLRPHEKAFQGWPLHWNLIPNLKKLRGGALLGVGAAQR